MTQQAKIHTSMTGYEWFLLLLLSMVWGGSYFFVGVAVQELPTMTIVFGRVLIGAMVLLLALGLLGIALPRTVAVWKMFLMLGFLNNVVPFSLIVWGQSELASGVAAIINASTPLFTILVAHFATDDEKITPAKILGVLLGFIGVVVLIGFQSLTAFDSGFWASIACIGAAVSYAFAGVYGRRFARAGIAPMATATGQICASSLLMLPMVLYIDQPWTLALPSLGVIGSVVSIGVLSTALAYMLYFRILSTAGATNLLLVTVIVPVNAVILGIGFLGEVLFDRHIIGMVIIAVGLVIIDGRLFQKLKRL